MSDLNKSLDNGIKIINQIANGKTTSLDELATDNGLTLAATKKIINTLLGHNLIHKDANGHYTLGSELFFLGRITESRTDTIKIIKKEMEKLVADIDETVYLTKRNNKHIVFIEGVHSSHHIQYTPEIGKLYPLPYGSTGHGFMAFMKAEEVREILDHYEIETDSNTFFKELEQIRKRKYAFSYEARFKGLSGFTFPIISKNGDAQISLNIAIPTYRYSEEKNTPIIERTRKTVSKIQFLFDYLDHNDI